MNQTQARILREAHNAYVKRINRMTKAQLADLYRADLADRGAQILCGGPTTKEALITALCGLHYPISKLNEAMHTIAHEVPHPDCPHCPTVNECPICRRANVLIGRYYAIHADLRKEPARTVCPASGQSVDDGQGVTA